MLIAIAIEGARLIARIERWRAFAGEPVRLLAHPYRPLRGNAVEMLRAEFADESRWRDVLYVAVNLPLAIIEFVVVLVTWALALSLVTTPIWNAAARAEPFWLVAGTLSGAVLLARLQPGRTRTPGSGAPAPTAER